MTEIKDILKLSVEERLHLVQTIWDSISGEAEETPISDEHKAIRMNASTPIKKSRGQ